MRLLAIDPGNMESALLVYDTGLRAPAEWVKTTNQRALLWLDAAKAAGATKMAVEAIASYGMAVGATTFETCVWSGRFIERWQVGPYRPPALEVYRREVKLYLCGSAAAKDTNIRQALIDRYGGKEKAIGKKATPGPLYGISGDCWSALAVAVTVADRAAG